MQEHQGVVTRAKAKQLKSHKDQIEQEKFQGLNFDVQDFIGQYSRSVTLSFLYHRIFNDANWMWYNTKLKNKLVVERIVYNLLESPIVLEYFKAMGWNSLVTMTGEYYSNLVREFYANMFFKYDPYKIDTTTIVKGVRIHLDRAILAQILGVPNEGHSVFYERGFTSIFADSTWVYYDTLARFGVQSQAVGKRVLKSNDLEGTWKVASLLIATNITPRSPNQTNKLRMIDCLGLLPFLLFCGPHIEDNVVTIKT
ncbi:hypothetical protein M9H77_22444 [Catharanthus roseus]|uniref:Uncharacterized protein n=1 Tax=Catharanthus roseus TaxID=4058 RepID=A0ACC0AUI0_CATRO|nr:hypothetical protein M9H77_22444 [Catharanthus roseus]